MTLSKPNWMTVVIILISAVAVAYIINEFVAKKKNGGKKMAVTSQPSVAGPNMVRGSQPMLPKTLQEQQLQYSGVGPNVSPNSTEYDAVNVNQPPAQSPPGACPLPQGQFLASALLPKEGQVAENWSEFSPQNLQGRNFLNSTKFMGIDTVGSSLKNPSYDLRSEPPNPMQVISPWNNTTIMPDVWRRSFEIGPNCVDPSLGDNPPANYPPKIGDQMFY